MKKEILKVSGKKVSYVAKGQVWGNAWGGGKIGYASKTVKAYSLKELREKILAGIKNGSLDSGMGYESVYGAVMEVKTIATITVNGEEYEHIDYEVNAYGDIDEKEYEASMSIMME